jgi:hypothetical protein
MRVSDKTLRAWEYERSPPSPDASPSPLGCPAVPKAYSGPNTRLDVPSLNVVRGRSRRRRTERDPLYHYRKLPPARNRLVCLPPVGSDSFASDDPPTNPRNHSRSLEQGASSTANIITIILTVVARNADSACQGASRVTFTGEATQGFVWKNDDNPFDDEFEAYEQFRTQFESKPDTVDWYTAIGHCHWLAP